MSSRILALSLAVYLLLGLAACGPKEKPEEPATSLPVTSGGGSLSQAAPEEPDAPAREPIGSPAVILYPELADETLTASALYRQALERPSVICYQDEPLTDPQVVRDFLAAAEKGKDQDLYLYQFRYWENSNDPYNCYLVHFFTDGGTTNMSEGYSSNWNNMEGSDGRPLASISLNEYGFLIYRGEGITEPSAVQVVNDRTLYDDAEEYHRLRDTYLEVLRATALSQPWSSTEELAESASLVWIFEDLYYSEGGDPWASFGANWPLDTMVETLSRYFDGVTKEMIVGRKYADRYDPQTDTIFYEGGRGGMTPSFRVTGWTREGDQLMIDCEQYDPYSGVPVENGFYTLTVRTLEDGGFRYLSNLPRE